MSVATLAPPAQPFEGVHSWPGPRGPALIRNVPIALEDDPDHLAAILAASNSRIVRGRTVPVMIEESPACAPTWGGSVLRFKAGDWNGDPAILADIVIDRVRLSHLQALRPARRDVRFVRWSRGIRSVGLVTNPPASPRED